MASPEPLIVAIDGPSGVGKSTAARRLAERLRIPYLDTGAMYRALALVVLDAGIDPGDQRVVEEAVARVDLELAPAGGGEDPCGVLEVLLRGEPVGDRIRTPEVSRATSAIAVYPAVRRRLVALQRHAAGCWGGVVEGRDIGTRVFPDTPHKFFLEARPEVRHRRRWEELRARGREVALEDVAREMSARDERDSQRRDSPLRRDPTHRLVDTSDDDIEAVVEAMLAAVRATGGD